ncbi:hypothetical protein L7F22_066848, partial [Adiantum nelumboides]|nr:hypothetical protein [Adiantum nelumboides]
DFALGIQTLCQKDMCQKYGDGNLIAMDATFSTNKYKFILYIVLVFDAHRNGVPVAWILTSSTTMIPTCLWLFKFRNTMLDHHKCWEPAAFMVDDAETKIMAIKLCSKHDFVSFYTCIYLYLYSPIQYVIERYSMCPSTFF